MSVIKGKKLQLGYDGTASNNFTLYQPGTPDGTLRLANGIAGAETDVMTLTSAGNVGIGKTNPSAPLTIGRVNSISEGGELSLCRSSDNSGVWSIDVYGSTSTPSLRFIDNTAGAVRMEIDGSGRITTPARPAFIAYRTSNQTISNNFVSWTHTLVNTGSHFNTSTGKFTAPVSGLYWFNFILSSGSSQSLGYSYLDVNGTRVRDFLEAISFGVNTEFHASCIQPLNAGDIVGVVVAGATFTVEGGNEQYQSRFEGYLIG